MQQQCGDAARHRGRLRRARHGEVVVAVLELGVRGGDLGVIGHQAHDMSAWGDQIRLDEALDGRPGGRERSQAVIRPGARRIVIGHRADGDDIGHVARHADGHRVGAGVAGRGHDHDAGLPGAHHGLIERVLPVVGLRRRAEGEVEHADVVFVLVGHCPVDAADDVHVAARAIRVEGPDRHQLAGRRNAGQLAVQALFGAQRHAGHVGAVPALVRAGAQRFVHEVGVLRVIYGVVLRQQPERAVQRPVQVGPPPVAGVDHGDRHPAPVDPLRVQLVRPDQRRGQRPVRRDFHRRPVVPDLDVVDEQVVQRIAGHRSCRTRWPCR